ncbi:Sec-independent protein translocase protein TatB [Helicobacter sp. 23-1045]
MFDFSFGEILVIAIIAVIFLGPDKLPEAFVKFAKFLRAVKKTINDAKESIDREIHITEMKQDALEYKKKFEDSALKLKDEILQDADFERVKSTFDEVENMGKEMQNKIAESSAKSTKDSAKKRVLTPKIAESKKVATLSEAKNPKKSADSAKKRALKPKIAESSADSAPKKRTPKAKTTKKSKNENK